MTNSVNSSSSTIETAQKAYIALMTTYEQAQEEMIQKVGNVWRVCLAGMCKDHQQEWQAKVFYHQMLESSAEPQARDQVDSNLGG